MKTKAKIIKPAKKPKIEKSVQKPAAKPKRGPGSGKPNIHMKAKAAGVDHRVPDGLKPEKIEMLINPDLIEAMESGLGRPTNLTPDLGSRVCTLLAQRIPLSEICEMEGTPSERSIFRWLAAPGDGPNGALYEAFRQSFTRALELRAHTRVFAIEEINARMTTPGHVKGPLDANTARVATDIQRVLMEVENRSRFGKHVTIGGDKKNPIEVRNSKALSDAELLAIASGAQIDNAED